MFLSAPFSIYKLLTRTYNESVNYRSVLFFKESYAYNENETCIICIYKSLAPGFEKQVWIWVFKVCYCEGHIQVGRDGKWGAKRFTLTWIHHTGCSRQGVCTLTWIHHTGCSRQGVCTLTWIHHTGCSRQGVCTLTWIHHTGCSRQGVCTCVFFTKRFTLTWIYHTGCSRQGVCTCAFYKGTLEAPFDWLDLLIHESHVLVPSAFIPGWKHHLIGWIYLSISHMSLFHQPSSQAAHIWFASLISAALVIFQINNLLWTWRKMFPTDNVFPLLSAYSRMISN